MFHRLFPLAVAQAIQVFNYKAPIVSLKENKGWIVDGTFKLVHTIDLRQFDHLVNGLTNVISNSTKNQDKKHIIEFHLQQIKDRLNLLRGKRTRETRSIDWIGTAWKWIAGNPDATDWNEILRSKEAIIENNNHQYKINEELFGVIQDVTQKMNLVIERYKVGIKDIITGKFEQDTLEEIIVIKEEINEIVRACQMAKSGTINTNLLNTEEINRAINEIETLPYANEIEAIEYGTPSIFTNGSMLLYVISMPKVGREEYNLLITRSSIIDGKQIDLKFRKMLINQKRTYGIIANCLSINNATICEDKALKKISEDSCVAGLLKGVPTSCTFQTNNEEVIELIKEDTIFLTNFKGELISKNVSRPLAGTYIIQIFNETIQLKDMTFSSSMATTLQALPSALMNITKQNDEIDLGYVHELSIRNIKTLKNLTQQFELSIFMEAVILLLGASIVFTICRKIYAKPSIPAISSP